MLTDVCRYVEQFQKSDSIAMFGPVSDRSEHRRYRDDSQREYDMLFKVVLTGDSNSGKSRVLQQFLSGQSTNTKPTIGVEFTSKMIEMDNRVINL